MNKTRISLMFDHPGCPEDIVIDIHLPLPDPIEANVETMAERVRPTCPICKRPMRYAGFGFSDDEEDDDAEEEISEQDRAAPQRFSEVMTKASAIIDDTSKKLDEVSALMKEGI